MRLALIDECYDTKGFGGISSWTKRLTSYYEKNGLSHQIFSYSNGLKTRLPNFIKLFPNLREMMIYPYLGRRYLPQIEQEFDVIHFSTAYSMALYSPNVPSVISVHYIPSRQNTIYKQLLPFKYKLLFNPIVHHWFRKLERMAYPRADRIIVCKEEFKQYLVESYAVAPEKDRVIKYGLDPAQFSPEWDWQKKERMVLFVGRGSVGKGFDTLVGAAPKIKGNIVAVASRIPKFYWEKISQLTNFKVMTGIPSELLVELYKKATVFVMPSLSEGSPITTLEAMACGLPVASTLEGGGGYIEDGINGCIFPVRDPEGLAQKVNYLFDHPEIAREFGKINRERVEQHFTLPVIAEQVLGVYSEITS
ncbi:MAG TPA: glycosyltransferase family 4 protein [bacterium]